MKRAVFILASALMLASFAVPAAAQDSPDSLDDLMAAELDHTESAPDATEVVGGSSSISRSCQVYVYNPSTPQGIYRVEFKACVNTSTLDSIRKFGGFRVTFKNNNGSAAYGNVGWTSPSGYPSTHRALRRSSDGLALAGTYTQAAAINVHTSTARSVVYLYSGVGLAVYSHSWQLIVRLPNGQRYGPIYTVSYGCYLNQTC